MWSLHTIHISHINSHIPPKHSIRNDILELHYNRDCMLTRTRRSYFFCKMLLHPNVRRFQAKNYRLMLADWQHLFENYFGQLKVLNLSLSCCDALLALIPRYCPLLEGLNATCKFERMESHGNAMSFSLAVTDNGLTHLVGCKRLRVLTLNEARSKRKGLAASITHDGLRKLLRDVPTLEDINYSDSGCVIAKHMHDVQHLRLKVVRHFNATYETVHEIFRLCPLLEELYLVFFNCENREDVVVEMIDNCRRTLRTLELNNLTLGTFFPLFFKSLGSNLSFLSLVNHDELYTLENLTQIGRHCPNLKYLGLVRVCNTGEPATRPDNIGQFAQLESLYLIGYDLHLELVLTFCTENAEGLQNLKVSDRAHDRVVNDLFVNKINLHGIKNLEVSSKMEFSLDGIRRLVQRYDAMEHLSVFCREDCTEFVKEIQSNNFVFTLINKNNPAFW